MKIRVPLPQSFQGIHAVAAGLHQCRGHLSRVLVESGPEFYQSAESAKQNLGVLKDQFANQIQVLSEQLLIGATQFKDVVFEKYEEAKSSEFLGEVVRGTTTVLNASIKQAQSASTKFQQYVQPVNATSTSSSEQAQPQHPIVTSPPQQTDIPVKSEEQQKPVVEERFKATLTSLSEMGFCDARKNLELAERFNGNLDLCLQELLQ